MLSCFPQVWIKIVLNIKISGLQKEFDKINHTKKWELSQVFSRVFHTCEKGCGKVKKNVENYCPVISFFNSESSKAKSGSV